MTLEEIAGRYSQADAKLALARMRRLRVAVVGEAIVDEYVYCNALGKSGKEPMLVSRHLRADVQAGGTLAIANHVAAFSSSVELVSGLGAEEPREELVRSSLAAGVRGHFIMEEGAPTIVKRRYIDAYSLAKMMGIYHINPAPLNSADEGAFCELLEEVLPRVDVVVVADYGHGLITDRAVRLLVERSPFLCVNTQMNAANQGYHTLSKYPRADYACLHEGELRLDARDLQSPLETLVERTAKRVGAKALTVTRGKTGTLLFQPGDGFFTCPAVATKVVERVGAGDAVLSVTSLAVAAAVAPELVGLFGNVAGALQVEVVGNSASVKRADLEARVADLLPQCHRLAAMA